MTHPKVRSGHGMTIGSEMSGGARNITYRNIFYNQKASSATAYPGGPSPKRCRFTAFSR